MNARQIGLFIVLADFVAFSGYVLYHYGYIGVYEQALVNAATLQVLFDLVIALVLFTIWMVRDARERGISVWPFVLTVVTLGSIGALAYLIRREAASATATAGVVARVGA